MSLNDRRWLYFQLSSLVIAAVLAYLTWDPHRGWGAQDWVVPVLIALAPLFLRSAFRGEAVEGANAGGVRVARAVVFGMAVVEAVNVAVGALDAVPWSYVGVVVAGCVVIQIGAALYAVSHSRNSRGRT